MPLVPLPLPLPRALRYYHTLYPAFSIHECIPQLASYPQSMSRSRTSGPFRLSYTLSCKLILIVVATCYSHFFPG